MTFSNPEKKPLLSKKVKKNQSTGSLNGSSTEKILLLPIFICVIIVIFVVYLNLRLIDFNLNADPVEDTTTIKHNKSWKFLLFTQQWPISFCNLWTEKDHLPVTSCNFGENEYAWTVHGIWPTTSNTAYPEFCGKIPFNESVIEPIEQDLNEHWTTIQKDNGTSFWKHEWLKHGTCAVQIPELDTEFKYFSQGLEWNKEFNISDAFQSCKILPDDSKLYQSSQIVECLGNYFKAIPQIYCEHDSIRNEDLLLEIRFCVDKELKFISCDTYHLNALCKENIIYPATVLLPQADTLKTD